MTYGNTIFFVNPLFFSFLFSVQQLFSAVTFTNACRASLGFCKVIIVDPLAVCIFKSSAILSSRLPTTQHPMRSALASSVPHSITFFISLLLSFFLPWARSNMGQGDTGPANQSCQEYSLLSCLSVVYSVLNLCIIYLVNNSFCFFKELTLYMALQKYIKGYFM